MDTTTLMTLCNASMQPYEQASTFLKNEWLSFLLLGLVPIIIILTYGLITGMVKKPNYWMLMILLLFSEAIGITAYLMSLTM